MFVDGHAEHGRGERLDGRGGVAGRSAAEGRFHPREQSEEQSRYSPGRWCRQGNRHRRRQGRVRGERSPSSHVVDRRPGGGEAAETAQFPARLRRPEGKTFREPGGRLRGEQHRTGCELPFRQSETEPGTSHQRIRRQQSNHSRGSRQGEWPENRRQTQVEGQPGGCRQREKIHRGGGGRDRRSLLGGEHQTRSDSRRAGAELRLHRRDHHKTAREVREG